VIEIGQLGVVDDTNFIAYDKAATGVRTSTTALVQARRLRGSENRLNTSSRSFFAPLAQLDRASGYEPEGREFESLRAHHFFVFPGKCSNISFGVPSH
jgi:hypothetical protein